MRTVLVILHAAPGVVGDLTGLLALSPPRPTDRRRGWRLAYPVCIAMLIAGLGALLLYDWSELDTPARMAFTGLVGLAAVMAFRLWRANREASSRRDGWPKRYVNHVYFTYIALWIGLLIVPAINSPFPLAAVPLVVVVALSVGHVLVTRYKRRLVIGTGCV